MAFRGLQAESMAQGAAHRAVAKELENLVAGPFEEWAQSHEVNSILYPQYTHLISGCKGRIRSSKTSLVDGWLKAYEQAQGDVSYEQQLRVEDTLTSLSRRSRS